MSKRIFIRIIAVVLMLCMILPVSGCNSLFSDITVEQNTSEEKTDSNFSWPIQGERRVEVKNTYKSGGTDAFYIDEEKCLKDEIEEFHLVHAGSDFTVYYYTAAANPSYKSATGTGYYCLAAYNFSDKKYKIITHGFYDKKNGNASFAFKKEPDHSYFFACIGDTFMDVSISSAENAKIFRTFTLSGDDKESIRDEVGGNYVCTDITYIDYGADRIAAVFMRADQSEDEEDTDIAFAEYDIDFDTDTEDPVHDVDRINTGIIDTDSIVSSGAAYPAYGTVFTYNYQEGASKLKLFRDSPFLDRKSARGANVSLKCKSSKEELVSLAVREFEGTVYLFFLFNDRLQVYRVNEKENDKFSYTGIGRFALDKSDSYAIFDVTPSIVMVSPEKIFGCSLDRGFYAQSIDEDHTQIKDGSYYAAYPIDDTNYYVIGFDNKTHTRTTTNYVNDKVVSKSTVNVEYTMGDLPFAKIYTVAIPYHLQ